MSEKPFRRDRGRLVESVAERLDDGLDPRHRVDGSKNMRRVSALTTSRLNEITRERVLQDRLEEPPLRAMVEQPGPELAQDGVIEAAVGEREAEEVLPVDPRADSVSGLAVGQRLHELEDQNECEPGWCGGRLPNLREEVGEVVVSKERFLVVQEPVTHLHDEVSLREYGSCDVGGVVRDGEIGAGTERHGGPLGSWWASVRRAE